MRHIGVCGSPNFVLFILNASGFFCMKAFNTLIFATLIDVRMNFGGDGEIGNTDAYLGSKVL